MSKVSQSIQEIALERHVFLGNDSHTQGVVLYLMIIPKNKSLEINSLKFHSNFWKCPSSSSTTEVL